MNGMKIGMLVYPDTLQNWLDSSRGLLIFLISAPIWLRETDPLWLGFADIF